MLEEEVKKLIDDIQRHGYEKRTLEIKTARKACPERLYDTFSAFANQNEGGVLLFGIDEAQGFARVGVYNPQDLQRKLMEVGEAMTPLLRPVITIYTDEAGHHFVTAEIAGLAVEDRPCFNTARGRLRGAFVRVGGADKPMTEYEVYSYDAYRRKIRDELRPVERLTKEFVDERLVARYLDLRMQGRTNMRRMSPELVRELSGITNKGQFTMLALLLCGIFPQAFYPQLAILACRVAGKVMGEVDANGARFVDSARIEGTIPEMLEGALGFVRRNMRTEIRISPQTGHRQDVDEYPVDALREAILNALIHRDYSIHTENMPIRVVMYQDRIEISNPGGLYGRLTVDTLGTVQADTRNPVLVVAMEALGETENRYSGIPRIRQAMEEAGLPEPVFKDTRDTFLVRLYNRDAEARPATLAVHEPNPDAYAAPYTPTVAAQHTPAAVAPRGEAELLAFCATPRTRREIADFFGIASMAYVMRRYVSPLIERGALCLTLPEHPKSCKQRYRAV